MRAHEKARLREASRKRRLMIGASIGVAIGSTALACGAAALLSNSGPTLDEALCPASGQLPATTMLVADLSDAPLNSQSETLRLTVLRERDRTQELGKLTLLSVNAKGPYEPAEQVSLCAPLAERDAGVITHTPQQVARRWRRVFGEPVERAVVTTAKIPGADASPLAETITAASWRTDWSANQGRRRLVIVSDLMQHDPTGFSLYTGDATAFAKSGVARRARPDLTGVDVEIVVLRRPDFLERQTAVAEPFWVAWLTARGAASVRFQGEPQPRRPDASLLRTFASASPQSGN